jgi:hypothetical protein
MPQGSPKKIQVDLLLADLALQLGDPPLRPRQLALARRDRRARHRRCPLARSSPLAQRRRPTRTNLVPPCIQKPAAQLQIPRNLSDAFPGRHTRQRGPLQSYRIFPVFRHQFLSSRNCPLFSVSHFWGALQPEFDRESIPFSKIETANSSEYFCCSSPRNSEITANRRGK